MEDMWAWLAVCEGPLFSRDSGVQAHRAFGRAVFLNNRIVGHPRRLGELGVVGIGCILNCTVYSASVVGTDLPSEEIASTDLLSAVAKVVGEIRGNDDVRVELVRNAVPG